MNDGEYTAVLDRFEKTTDSQRVRVVLLEEDDELVEELHVPVDRLPDEAGQDAVLSVTITDGKLESSAYDQDETRRRTQSIQERFDRLAERSPDDDS